jgi:hypothetical protein
VGLSVVAQIVADLVDVLAAHPPDPHRQALAMDRAVAQHIEPWTPTRRAATRRGCRCSGTRSWGGLRLAAPSPNRLTFAALAGQRRWTSTRSAPSGG